MLNLKSIILGTTKDINKRLDRILGESPMARISDSELARLKQDISLERLAEASGIQLKQHGNDLTGLCPFHDDKEPSLVISTQKKSLALLGRLPNRWQCHRLGDEGRRGVV
jgi:hypothetical protein